MRFLEFLDAEDDDEEEDLLNALLEWLVSTPLLAMVKLADRLAEDYDLNEAALGPARKMSQECLDAEQYLASSNSDTQLQGVRALLLKYPNDTELIISQYRRILSSEQHHSTASWLDFVYYLRSADIKSRECLHWALKSNPSCAELWTEFLLKVESGKSLFELDSFFIEGSRALEHFYGRESAALLSFTQEFIAVLWRRSGGAEEFRDLAITLVENRTGRERLDLHVHLTCARFLFLHGHPALGRLVMDDALLRYESEASYWATYAELETAVDKDKSRQLFSKGVLTLASPSHDLAQAWIAFERVYGDLCTFDTARQTIFAHWGPSCLELSPSTMAAAGQAPELSAAKRAKTEVKHAEPVTVEIAPKRELTVFVNNIDFKVDEAQLRALFEQHAGPVNKVHLGRKESGESRGFANIEFHTDACATKALELDRTRMNGRPLFISPYQAVGGKDWASPVPVHSQGRDPRILYVSHLPAGTTEGQLVSVFAKYEGFESVRLGMAKSGACKGFAYIQFASEQDAAKALCEDGGLLLGQQISVLVSDPALAPKKQKQKTTMVPLALSRGKPKARLGPGDAQPTNPEPPTSGDLGTGRSNDDFRKMLGL